MVAIGVDPGKQGGLVIIDGEKLVLHYTPVTMAKSGNDYLPREMFALLQPYAGRGFALIEQITPRQVEGIRSAKSSGYGVGLWTMAFAGNNIGYEDVPAAVWKRHFNLLGCDKKASRAKAQAIWPAYHGYFQLVKSDALAEAALIALYGQRRRLGSERKAA